MERLKRYIASLVAAALTFWACGAGLAGIAADVITFGSKTLALNAVETNLKPLSDTGNDITFYWHGDQQDAAKLTLQQLFETYGKLSLNFYAEDFSENAAVLSVSLYDADPNGFFGVTFKAKPELTFDKSTNGNKEVQFTFSDSTVNQIENEGAAVEYSTAKSYKVKEIRLHVENGSATGKYSAPLNTLSPKTGAAAIYYTKVSKSDPNGVWAADGKSVKARVDGTETIGSDTFRYYSPLNLRDKANSGDNVPSADLDSQGKQLPATVKYFYENYNAVNLSGKFSGISGDATARVIGIVGNGPDSRTFEMSAPFTVANGDFSKSVSLVPILYSAADKNIIDEGRPLRLRIEITTKNGSDSEIEFSQENWKVTVNSSGETLSLLTSQKFYVSSPAGYSDKVSNYISVISHGFGGVSGDNEFMYTGDPTINSFFNKYNKLKINFLIECEGDLPANSAAVLRIGGQKAKDTNGQVLLSTAPVAIKKGVNECEFTFSDNFILFCDPTELLENIHIQMVIFVHDQGDTSVKNCVFGSKSGPNGTRTYSDKVITISPCLVGSSDDGAAISAKNVGDTLDFNGVNNNAITVESTLEAVTTDSDGNITSASTDSENKKNAITAINDDPNENAKAITEINIKKGGSPSAAQPTKAAKVTLPLSKLGFVKSEFTKSTFDTTMKGFTMKRYDPDRNKFIDLSTLGKCEFDWEMFTISFFTDHFSVFMMTEKLPETDPTTGGGGASAGLNYGSSSSSGSSGSSSGTTGTTSTATTSSQVTSRINSAPTGGTVKVSGVTQITGDQLTKAASKNVTIDVKIDDIFTWNLDPIKMDSKKTIDLMITSATVSQTDVLKNVFGSFDNIVGFKVNAEGLGTGAKITVKTSSPSSANAPKYANLFKVNTDGTMTFVTCAKTDMNGFAQLNIQEPGTYAVITSSDTKLIGDVDNSCGLNVKDATAELKVLLEIPDDEIDVKKIELAKLDANGDGKFTIKDVTLLLKVIVGTSNAIKYI